MNAPVIPEKRQRLTRKVCGNCGSHFERPKTISHSNWERQAFCSYGCARQARYGRTVEDRFMSKVAPEPNTGCWLWTGSAQSERYGGFKYNGRDIPAHRAAYEIFVGAIPNGLEIDHLCRMTWCVNPEHLEPVTHHENTRRGLAGKYLKDRTHCKNGHPFDGENLRADSRRRYCRQCGRDATNRHYRTKMAKGAR